MLTACGRIVHLGICCAVIGTAALATDGYRVILRDGSYIQALEKPVVENGIAKVRIGGGLFTAIPEGRIDWRRSDAASNEDLFTGSQASAAPARPQATRAVGSGVFTLIGEPAPASAPAEGGGAAPAAAPAAAAPDPGAEIRERIAALNNELDELQQAKLDVEDQIRKTIKLEEIPDLRRRVDQLDAEIKSKRGEISGLILRETAPRP